MRLFDDAQALARVVGSLGHADFGTALLAWLQATPLKPAHVTAFRFDAQLQARVVVAAGAGRDRIARQSARLYAGSGLARHDRLLAALAGGSPAAVVRVQRRDIVDSGYGQQLWDRHGLVDRLSALSRGGDGIWTTLNVYRDAPDGAFTSVAVRRFTEYAPLLSALLDRHLASLQPAAAPGPARRVPREAAAALLARLPGRLSPRELEVCALSLSGHTRAGSALVLGLAESSVATLRERAYRKLGIHGTGELFALCLRQQDVQS